MQKTVKQTAKEPVSVNHTPASALKGHWILEQLDKTGIATWKLGFILCLTGALLALIGLLVMGDLPDESLLADFYTSTQMSMIAVSTGFMIGVFLVLGLYLARNVQSNTECSLPSQGIKLRQTLEPTWSNLLIIIFFASLTLITFAYVNYLTIGFNTCSFTEVVKLGQIGILTQYLLQPIVAVAGGACISVLLSVFRYLTTVAYTVEINLLHLDAYKVLGSPFIYFFVSISILMSIIIAFAIFIHNEDVTLMFLYCLAAVIVVGIVVAVTLSYPVWVFRRRLMLKKAEVRNKIIYELDKLNVVNAKRSSLLTELIFIDQLPDSSFATYLKRIIVFGILPPLTWVLAATVENFMFN